MISLFLKSRAKEKLKGVYLKTVLGMLVCYIPEYILSQTIIVATVSLSRAQSIGAVIIPSLIAIIVSIFVTDIFGVGFFRSLVELNDCQGEKTYNINRVLSGFGKNYINFIKLLKGKINEIQIKHYRKKVVDMLLKMLMNGIIY